MLAEVRFSGHGHRALRKGFTREARSEADGTLSRIYRCCGFPSLCHDEGHQLESLRHAYVGSQLSAFGAPAPAAHNVGDLRDSMAEVHMQDPVAAM